MAVFKCRKFARKQDIVFTESFINIIIKTIDDVEKMLLNANNTKVQVFPSGNIH